MIKSPPALHEHSADKTYIPSTSWSYYFDLRYYRERNADLDHLASGSLFCHYIAHGKAERREARLFHPLLYWQMNPDVKQAGIEPLSHFLNSGKSEGREATYFYPHLANVDFTHHIESYDQTHLAELLSCSFPHDYISIPPRYEYFTPDRPVDFTRTCKQSNEEGIRFSIITPLYSTIRWQLEELINSVLCQWYSNWELLLVDDGELSTDTLDLIDSLKKDNRIRFLSSGVTRTGISEASNRGIHASVGTHLVFLDHDDTLTDDALFRLAEAVLDRNPDIIYSDEDKIDSDGNYLEPHFKPCWSPDTIMSIMYTCHLSCFSRDIISKVGYLRKEFDGCQDWDLILRASEITDNIHHVPRVLYHWRKTAGSVSQELCAKPYVIERSKEVRRLALNRRKIDGTFAPMSNAESHFNVEYNPPQGLDLSIVIPSKNNSKILGNCLESLHHYARFSRLEIVIIDNGSTGANRTDNERLASHYGAEYLYIDAAFNFSSLCNAGARRASGDILLFLNDDTELIDSYSLTRLISLAALPHAGAVGAKLYYPKSQLVQHCGVVNTHDGPSHAYLGCDDTTHPEYFLRRTAIYNWIAVTGACLAIKRVDFKKVGGFDERLPVAYNDISLCFSLIELGKHNVVCPMSHLIHHESVSRGVDHQDARKSKRLQRDREYLLKKHPSFAFVDPYYSIHHRFNHSAFN